MSILIRSASELDAPVLLDLIRQLAEYEKLGHLVAATEERLRETLFGAKPAAEALLSDCDGECAGFAVFFATYSTFLAQPGIYLEDLYVKAHLRGKGVGSALLRRLAGIAVERGCVRGERVGLARKRPADRESEVWGKMLRGAPYRARRAAYGQRATKIGCTPLC